MSDNPADSVGEAFSKRIQAFSPRQSRSHPKTDRKRTSCAVGLKPKAESGCCTRRSIFDPRADAASRPSNNKRLSLEHLRVFIGWDERESIGGHAFLESLLRTTGRHSVSVTFLTAALAEELGLASDGTNAFTRARFAIPALCDFLGYAIYLDGADMLCREDLAKLWKLRNGWQAIQVVPHEYETRFPRKYIGTDLEADNASYPRKNQSSVMLWACEHYMNRKLTPEFIAQQPSSYLHRFEWLPEDRIGRLPMEWNHLVGEQVFNPQAKIAHYTLGIPAFKAYSDADYSEEWKQAMRDAMRGMQYPMTLHSAR